jgi:hypothetical protein
MPRSHDCAFCRTKSSFATPVAMTDLEAPLLSLASDLLCLPNHWKPSPNRGQNEAKP